MTDEMMDRQESLGLEVPESVAVVGCGGVGSWLAYFLALAGVPELWLFDMDTISIHNLNRIPLPAESVGKKKSEAVAEMIRAVRPKCNVLAMGAFNDKIADGLSLSGEISWIIATTDTLASRQAINKWAMERGIRYIEAAAEGEFGSCTGEPAEWSTPDEASPGYAHVPVWVGPCVFAAGIACAYVLHACRIGMRAIRMGWQKTVDSDLDYLPPQFVMFDSQVEEEDEYNEQEQEEKNV